MKLNADILFQEISAITPVVINGPHLKELSLCRPEFYLDGSKEFLSNHCYVASADHLPSRPILESNAVLIVLGSIMRIGYYADRCCLITIPEEIGIFRLFNEVQAIFDKYERWDESLHEHLKSYSDISAFLENSRQIIGNPLGVIDRNFRYIGLTDQEIVSEFLKTPVSLHQSLDPDLFRRFLNATELTTMSVREPLTLDIENYKTMNLNLFDGDTYLGCLTIWNIYRAFRPGDSALACHLRGILEQAIKQGSAENTSERAVLRQVLKDAIDGLPTTYDKRRRIMDIGSEREYVCAKLEVSTRLSNLPLGYVCSNVEDAFPRSTALEHGHGVVAFIDVEGLKDADGCYLDNLFREMRQLADRMDLRVGLSDAFTDVFSSRLFFLQSGAALSNGQLLDHSERVFDFQKYALTELVINSLGEMPVELFYFEGLRRIFRHDAESQTSYTNTLRVYLNNNLSITKTASDLFVHRSTLLERLSRIERELGVDLKDPDIQLLLRIILKAQEIHGRITNKSPN